MINFHQNYISFLILENKNKMTRPTIVVETIEESCKPRMVFITAEELFPKQSHETTTQRFPLQTESWLNNVTLALATIIGINNINTSNSKANSVELPPQTETQCKSKTKINKDKNYIELMRPKMKY